jgi:hypothetical protein
MELTLPGYYKGISDVKWIVEAVSFFYVYTEVDPDDEPNKRVWSFTFFS